MRVSRVVDAGTFVLGSLVLVGTAVAWFLAGVDPRLLPAVALSIPLGWVLTRFPLTVTGGATGVYVPFAPVLLVWLLCTQRPTTALLAWGLTALPAYLVDRRAWTSRLFNAGSALLAGLAATGVHALLVGPDLVSARTLLAVLAAAGAYFLADFLASAFSIAVESGARFSREVRDPAAAVGGLVFEVVATLGFLTAAVQQNMPDWVGGLMLVPVLAVVVAAWNAREATHRRTQQHELFRAAVLVHAAADRDELFAALSTHGSQIVTGGRLEVTTAPPSGTDLSHPFAPVAGEPDRWLVARRPVAASLARFDEAALTSLAALGSAALVQVRLTEEAARHAMDDDLTGLPNRRCFTARLEAAVARRRAVAVLFVDLDGFKAVNDTFGHAAGDELLVEAARRLLEAVGPGGVAGRLGGDEFAVLLSDEQPGLVEDVCDAIVTAFAEPFLLGACPARISASVGAATSDTGDDADSLLSRADTAMYRAKRNGGSQAATAGGSVVAPGPDDRREGDRRSPRS